MFRILILAGDTAGNLGDMAIAQSTCDALKAHIPDAHISLVADAGDFAKMIPGTTVIPKGLGGLGALVKTAFRSNLIICGGGGLFQDDDSLIKMPYWGLRVVMARLLGDDLVGYCLGVGPLSHGLSRFFCRIAFACMRVISVRDPMAFEVARELTTRDVSIIPDPALALSPAPPEVADELLRAHGIASDAGPLIGVAVRKWFHRRGNFVPHKIAFRLGLGGTEGDGPLNRMTDLLAEVLDRLAVSFGAHIVFLPTYNVAHEGDDRVCGDIIRKMRSKHTSLIRISDPRLYKAVAGRLDVMLGGRMHPTIFSAGMGTPVVGLAYNPKFKGFFQMIDCADNLLSLDDFVTNRMTEELFKLISRQLKGSHAGMSTATSRLADRYRRFNADLAGSECNQGKFSGVSLHKIFFRHLESTPISTVVACGRVFTNQWRRDDKLYAIQKRKLQRIVRVAYENVTYYRRLFDACGLSPSDIRSLEDLERIPVTRKGDLQRAPREEILNRKFPIRALTSEHSSGSTGEPFRTHYDPKYHAIRNMLFLRGLLATGYRLGQKVLLLTHAVKKDKPLLRWYYTSILESPERLLEELNRHKPDLLYGAKTSLIHIAEHIRDVGIRAHRPKRIISKAETLSPGNRKLLENVFSAQVFDFYGSTEMGLVGWQCRAGGSFHLSSDSVLVEWLPIPGNSGLSRMIMTNLDLEAMPLIRYDTGDLGVVGPAEHCACGRGLPILRRVEGRLNDCIQLRNGRKISPLLLESMIEQLPNIRKYKVIQTDWEEFTVNMSINGNDRHQIAALVDHTMRDILGPAIRLKFDFEMPVDLPLGRKTRVIESKMPRSDF